MQTAAVEQPIEIQWPEEAETRVPYQVFFDSAIYEREQERIFRGPVWNYVGLEAEVPHVGDFKATFIGLVSHKFSGVYEGGRAPRGQS